MEKITSFHSDRDFFNDIQFPYGIERSGEFTRQQTELLIKHGWAYQALSEGRRSPANQEEQQFVAVFQGQREAESEHEKTWQRYCAKVTRPKIKVRSAYLNGAALSGSEVAVHSDDDFDLE